MFYQYSIARSNRCPNFYFDAINPSCNSTNLNVGGIKYPNRPLNPTNRPAEAFQEYLKAWGAVGIKSMSGIITRSAYGATLVAVTGSDSSIVVPSNGARNTSQIETAVPTLVAISSHMHYLGYDLDRMSGALFSGVNTRMSPPFIELNIASATDAAVTCYAFALSDCILKIDPATKTLEVLL